MNLRNVDLNLLVAFDALVDERSVTKAASRLCVGQSAMSATLGRLRLLLNDPVLVRQGREMVPTPVAESMVEPVREILDLTSSTLARRDEFDPACDSRHFSIVASDYVTFVFLRPLLAEFSEIAPNIRLNIRPITDGFVDELRRNRADLLITAKEALDDPSEFRHEELFSDRYVCVADANHPEIKGELTMDQFQTLPYAAMNIGRTLTVAELDLDERRIKRNVEITTTFLLCCFLLPGTRFISMVHERLARNFEKDLNLRLMDTPFEPSRITEMLLWTQRNTDDPGHKWLRDYLIDFAKRKFT